MKVTVREAARLLSVSEGQVYRWVESGEIPCSVVNHQPLFSRAELLEWATARRLPVSVALFEPATESGVSVRLADALARGGVHHGVPGSDRASVLRAVVERLPVADEEDRQILLQVLLAREALGSTAVGDGIAIPHVRSPLVFPGAAGVMAVCFLETPVAFGAPDGLPIHTIFALLSPTIRGHLQLLSRLSFALHDQRFKAVVLRRATCEEIVAEAQRLDRALANDGNAARSQEP
jgi:PTS system nitrogen regulatory IIA component